MSESMADENETASYNFEPAEYWQSTCELRWIRLANGTRRLEQLWVSNLYGKEWKEVPSFEYFDNGVHK